MSEKVLSSLMYFFASFFKFNAEINPDIAKNIVISFLEKQFDRRIKDKYTYEFSEIYQSLEGIENVKGSTDDTTVHFSSRLLINLPFKQRIFFLVNLLAFCRFLSAFVEKEDTHKSIIEKIDSIAKLFKIEDDVYITIKSFVFGEFQKVLDTDVFLTITGLNLTKESGFKKLIVNNLEGQFFILRFNFDFFLLLYEGEEEVYLGERLIIQDNVYIISNNTQITSKGFSTIHFDDVLKVFLKDYKHPKILFSATNIEYSFNRNHIGLHPFTFKCHQNEMVGIIGGSGAGKSTLLKLLCGVLPLKKGKLEVNGLNQQLNAEKIKSLIGYIPQEEILFEDLTVFENIFFHAKLCMKVESEKKLKQKIFELLESLNIYDIKDYKVGTVSRKIISGGQRKRLNIAMELIRDPQVLFIDEPTSGLSSSDAEKIINLLKQQVLKGKLVFITLHQPSNQVFAYFDKLIVIDKGGFPVYFGHPGDAHKYLQEKLEMLDTTKLYKDISDSEKILDLIEETTVDEYGYPTSSRKCLPTEWYAHFRETQNSKQLENTIENLVDFSSAKQENLKPPNRFHQFIIYLIRNSKSKFANKSYITISLIVAPLLALILSLFSKQMLFANNGELEYFFESNENIPSYIFMGIIVALFVGLMTSAEEIIKDKRNLNKEAFLNLSSASYLSSKVVYVSILSLFQTFAFSIISYWILKFNSGFIVFWIYLFSISLIANITGLFISTVFNTTVAVYILIPFIIIPQILLSGIVIKYDNIHHSLLSDKYTPLISDLVPTRWAYEGIIIDQFKNNKYQKQLFNTEQEISKANFKILAIIPELTERISDMSFGNNNKLNERYNNAILLKNELRKLGIPNIEKINIDSDLGQLKNKLPVFKASLNNLNYLLIRKRDSLFQRKDQVFRDLRDEFESNADFVSFKKRNFNTSVSKIVLKRDSFKSHIIRNNQIIQKSNPIYKSPESGVGRAHFYSSYKKIGDTLISTIIFNLIVINLLTLLLIILLYILFRIKYKFR